MKIDLVYTWVDDKDEKWIEKKSQFASQVANYNKDATDDCRFSNNDELKYSLRSVAQFAPWVNKIFIVTDNQVPQWLDTNNPKIQIIDHKDIIPNDKLPVFNSCVIENCIVNIKDLSEYFLIANDDTFFWDEVDENFFYSDEKPIVRVGNKISSVKKYKHLYGYTIFRAYKLIKEKLNKKVPYFPHHNIDSYKKSIVLECNELFKKEYETTLNNKFRDFEDLQRIIIGYYGVAKDEAILKCVEKNFFSKLFFKKETDSEYINLKASNIKKLKNLKTKLLCINNCRKTKEQDRKIMSEILEEKFPNKSEFEK